MKTRICSLLLAVSGITALAQIGINTPTPTATLDVNGTLKVRDIPQTTTLPGYQVMALNLGNAQVTRVDSQLLTDAAVTAATTNTSVYAARKTAGVNLLSLGLFPTGFRAVNFLTSERTVGAAGLFTDTDNSYTIPSSGVYATGFTFRYGSGLQAEILSNSPGIGIVRTRAGVGTLIDSRTFSGANLVLLSLTISETSLNSVYTFQAGDKVSFGLTGSNALSAALLGSSVASFYIYKISN
ncbi:hypothetical protein ODZ84_21825 [Chryseobacterium fluminis]|uniref:hypothetical protein n=1 Tax=Chryseobacterium fluminis TaxID=2983606 RepID=UPI00224FA28C|nr:hypothetical protein [Chryseobacterium sp. MMS21-Ot14]UZT97778.1 hypothetical protein ODZ84_21825 [Chryseobacterium sp. MMS21-Ot14]